ncbi:D-2-hydroxyacid dehydrogenase [Seonamhaeicola aphaedonensis]|uniref:Glycerate dehydrogenase n=1 Tax=Seonamhaeicola aphaedonensis TaxID=1461338 RepID=A0A3D9H923_9FLAO|nr:D-2-hydroxyacid dehydrogenase [Seonamhaeicola aphaedonensis]RED45993.1 glycerate dehydrogenase [Seonamhaeicola aphaedonensis]
MKIVVLDGFTLNPGDLSWDAIAEYGDLEVHDRTSHDTKDIIQAIGDAEIVYTNKTPLPKEVLENVPWVKFIGVLATGYNVVDVEFAKTLKIIVTNVPGYSTQSVAQFTMALILEMCHHIGDHSHAVHNGDWVSALDFCFWNTPLIELEGKTLGLIGFGSIGQSVSKVAQAFGLKILVNSRTKKPEFETETLKFVELDELFNKSDFISLHCPLFESTKGMINATNIEKMKDGVKIINTARGGLIVEKDLAKALNSGKVSGAAVDVVSEEPMKASNPLLKVKNCIMTPHIAWAPKEARLRLLNITKNNLEAYLNGTPVNVVNA